MDSFYSRYRNFTPDPNASIIENFQLLSISQNWAPGGQARRRAYQKFRDAIIEEFNATYGTDDHDLASWQNLCRVVGVEPVPETITQCKKAIRKTHVNLVDLVDLKRNGGAVTVFGSLSQLKSYTRETKKYFPKNPAKAGGILKALLRNMTTGDDE